MVHRIADSSKFGVFGNRSGFYNLLFAHGGKMRTIGKGVFHSEELYRASFPKKKGVHKKDLPRR
jgi:hypothetical protein